MNFDSVLQKFKIEAKKTFPIEEYAILVGTVDPTGEVELADLWWPEGRAAFCTSSAVQVQASWWRAARRWASTNNYTLLGDIHSHCYETPRHDATPSEDDIDRFDSSYFKYIKNRPFLMGICTISKDRQGRLRARSRLWPIQKEGKSNKIML